MNNFNFTEELVYGKKHLQKIKYDKNKYKFINYITELFGVELDQLHTIQKNDYEVFNELGNDSNTEFHKQFYKKLNEGWNIQEEYDNFIKNEIMPYLNLNEALVQKFPTFRVMLPNNVAIVIEHNDSDDLHKHPKGEINFIMALTDMYDTNTVNVEKMPRMKEFKKVILDKGETICFNGNNCNHYNEINKTGKTRVSFDFRILPLNYYNEHYDKSSASTNTKYIEGGYYKRFKIDKSLNKDSKYYYSYDYWFNNNVHDNWFQGGDDYYVNKFYENIIMKLDDIPKEGKILILGTHNCVAFDKLCKHFGYDRCIGYDLHNPNNHPNVIIKDCSKLNDADNIDIAFCHNDLGNYETTPFLKEHGQKWAAKNIIKGGYMLSNNNYNRAKVKNIEIMENNGFKITQLLDLEDKFDLSNLEFERKEGYMISKKMNTKNNTLYVARDIWDKQKELFNDTLKKYNVSDAWGVVDIFEKKIAEYAGSKYAVSVDNCTDALFLCMKYLKASGTIVIPSKTWISVPCTINHAGCKVQFEDIEWSGMYQLKPYPIYDGAVRMKKGMYKSNTYHCLSFHIRKHIPIGKGGMILTDDKEAYDWFRTVRYEGRTISDDGVNYMLYKDDPIKSMGWNMYMTPEQAAKGLELFENIKEDNPDQESSGTCKDLSKLNIYNTFK